LRINRAADDAAGLSISQKMRQQVAGYQQANRNVAGAINLIQTAEGGMNQISDILVRLQELATEASDDTLTDTDRSNLNDESTALLTEIDRISQTTKFNTKILLTGFTGTFQVGFENGDRIAFTFNNVQTNGLGTGSGLVGLSLTSQANANTALASVNAAIGSLNSFLSNIGASQNRLERVAGNLSSILENTQAAEATIRDVDVASEMANFTKQNILVQAGWQRTSSARSVCPHCWS
jgi:flagellin